MTVQKKMNSPSNVNEDMQVHCLVVTLEEFKQHLRKKQPDDVNILVTGDCHIATRSIPNQKIIDKLNEITSVEILEYTDQIVINGDLLDRRISLASDETVDFFNFIIMLILRCFETSTGLAVLEGTPSHDNKQPRLIKILADHMMTLDDLPVQYIEDISILDLCPTHLKDKFPDGIKSIFIPDEMNDDSQITWQRVQELLRLEGVDEVSMSFIHGMFRYQEAILTSKSHIEENYESVTKHTIAINHWHLPSAKGKIRAPGSIERMRHGEEETKGFYYITIRPDGTQTEYFVINSDATIYATIDVSYKTVAQVYEILDNLSNEYPIDSRIRLACTKQDEVYFALTDIKRKYPNFKISEKMLGKEDISKIEKTLNSIDTGVAIRPDTIVSLLEKKLTDVDAKVLERALNIVKAEME